jgi:undecaprenyl-diphosphatase
MPLYQVIIYAIVQGLTEFLPVSSSAHLEILPRLFGWVDPGLEFDIALHVGTLLAVVAYFFQDWVQIIAHGFGIKAGSDLELERNRKLLWLLAVGSIPVAIAGLIFKEKAENEWRNLFLIGAMLVIVGVVMWFAERYGKHARDLSGVAWIDSIVIGLSQALAVVPGTSRSGITIATGLFRNLDRAAAARFSFLLSTPAIAGAALLPLLKLRKTGGIPPEMLTPFLVGIAVSGLVGAVVIAFFMRYLRRSTLYPFIYYRIAFGIVVLAIAFMSRSR